MSVLQLEKQGNRVCDYSSNIQQECACKIPAGNTRGLHHQVAIQIETSPEVRHHVEHPIAAGCDSEVKHHALLRHFPSKLVWQRHGVVQEDRNADKVHKQAPTAAGRHYQKGFLA
jgi:hypothetical protein